MEELYGLNYAVKSLAVSNKFVTDTNKACYSLGKALTPFCIYGGKKYEGYDVIDFSRFRGFLDENISLVDEIAQDRVNRYRACGMSIDTSNETTKKTLFFDFLLSVSVCYIEVPKYITKDGVSKQAYDKFLATRNPSLMGAWMGLTPAEMQAKYSAKIAMGAYDFESHNIKFVKLLSSSKGNSISVPRKIFNVDNISCTPLYMLNAFVEGFKPHLQSGILTFSYLKDNGTIRNMTTTVNSDILREFYSDNLFLNSLLEGVDIDKLNVGGMNLSTNYMRGYIRVPELGASIYDGSGVRALNYARLVSIKKTSKEDVDTTFINVDLESVIQSFKDNVEALCVSQPDSIIELYKALVYDELEDGYETKTPLQLYEMCCSFVDTKVIYLTTEFKRFLHKFMISNPQWFSTYTGLPVRIQPMQNCGVEMLDF